jgi:hypothetical protein
MEPRDPSTHWRNYKWNDNRFDAEAFAEAAAPAPEAAPNSALKTVVRAIDLQRFLLQRFMVECHFHYNPESCVLQNGVWELFDSIRFRLRIDDMLEDLSDLEVAVRGHLNGTLSTVQEGLLSAALQETEDKCWYLQHYAKFFEAIFWGTYLDDSCELRMFEYGGVSLNDKFTTDSSAVNSWKVSRELESGAFPEIPTSYVPFICEDCDDTFETHANRTPFDVHGEMEEVASPDVYSDSDS